MKSKLRFRPLIRAAVFFMILSSFLLSSGPQVPALSVQEETVLGEQFLAMVRKQLEIVDDESANQYLNALGQYLGQGVETQYFPLRFYIVKNDTLNAFAGPGGHIFIFTGLFENIEGTEELASVLCHEIAHVSARHISEHIEQSKKINMATMAGMILGALVGGKVGTAIGLGSVNAGIQAQLNYTREDERQADQLGYKYMTISGFDPAGMLTILNTLGRGNAAMMNEIPPYLLTHPTSPERLSNIEIMLKKYKSGTPKNEVNGFTKSFPFIQAGLSAKYQKPEDAERLFQRNLSKGGNPAVAYFGLGLVSKERAEYDQALIHLKKALENQPKSLPILRNLGEVYLLKGDYDAALRTLMRVAEMNHADKPALRLLADTYQYMENFPKAADLYEKLISMEPVKDDVFYQLGLVYGKQDKLALAHYYFGVYHKRLREPDKARFHFEKAAGLAKDDPALKKRIESAMKDPA